MTHLICLTVYSVIGEFLFILSVFFFLDSQEAQLCALSVRIFSQTTYNTGLFVLDLNTAPWGCGMFHTHCRLIRAPISDASVY